MMFSNIVLDLTFWYKHFVGSISLYLKDEAHSCSPCTFTLFVEVASRARQVDQAGEEADLELGVNPKLVKLLLEVVRKNKVNAVGAKVEGVVINYTLPENILVL